MPTRIGNHTLYVKELARGHHVAYLENEHRVIVSSRWLDHKPDARELSRLAQEMDNEVMANKNPPSREQEKRKRVGDTTYTVEHAPYGMWILKANGVPLGYPSSYQHACEGFAALTETPKKNPRIVRGLTFGETPDFSEFEIQFLKVTGNGVYRIKNSRSHLVPDGRYSDTELYDLIQKLARMWNDGDEEAGQWGSDLMYSIGYEWV